MPSLSLAKAVPDQVINQGAVFKALDFKEFIKSENAAAHLRFKAELVGGQPLPQGLICTSDGILSGIPAQGTEGSYQVLLQVEDVEGEAFSLQFNLLIKEVNVQQQSSLMRDLKDQIWEAVGKDQPIPQMPDFGDMINWPVTAFDVYYLLERYAYLTIWDAYNLEGAGKLKPLQLLGASKHFNVYDRGSCLVASPKDLYSQERTPFDALITARAMANEVYKRGWTIEFSGFDKMVRAAWVRLQVLGTQQGKFLEVLHYAAPPEDAVIYNKEMEATEGQKPSV